MKSYLSFILKTKRQILSIFFIIIGHILIVYPSSWISNNSIVRFIDSFTRPSIPNLGGAIVGFFFYLLAILIGLNSVDRKKRELFNENVNQSKDLSFLRLAVYLSVPIFSYGIFLYLVSLGKFLWYFPLFWLVSILTIGLLIYVCEKPKMKKVINLGKNDLLLIFFLFIFGLTLLIFKLSSIPKYFIGDEGALFLKAVEIAQGRINSTIFDAGVYTFPLFGSYIQAIFIKIFGSTVFAWRFSSVITGLMTIFPIYILVKTICGRKLAVLSTIFFLTLQYFIAFSRLGYINIQAVPIVALAVLVLYYASISDNYIFWYITGVICGLSFYIYSSSQVSIVIAVLYVIYIGINRRYKAKKIISILTFIFLGFLVTYLPYVYRVSSVSTNALSHKWAESIFFNDWDGKVYFPDIWAEKLANKDIIKWQVGSFTLFYETELWFRILLRGVIRTGFVFIHPNIVDSHFVGSLTGSYTGLMFVLGWIILINGVLAKDESMMLIFIWFFSSFFWLSALNTIGARWTHLVPVIPSIAIITAFGSNMLYQNFINRSKRKLFRLLGTLLVTVIIVFSIWQNVHDYFILTDKEYMVGHGVYYPLQDLVKFGVNISME